MRDPSDLNYLYNAQDVIVLLEVMENKFQTMQEKTTYNPRKFDSASKSSSRIQREMPKLILEFPTNKSIMERFEKTLTGGFSRVNTHLSFDTELLMPNLTESDYKRRVLIKVLKLTNVVIQKLFIELS